MNTKDLMDFIDLHHEWLRKKYGIEDRQKEILARTVKIMEELGELSEKVLSFNSFQVKRKLDNFDKEDLPEEFADVIFTTLILAKSMDIDIRKALEDKMEKVKLSHKES